MWIHVQPSHGQLHRFKLTRGVHPQHGRASRKLPWRRDDHYEGELHACHCYGGVCYQCRPYDDAYGYCWGVFDFDFV